MYGEERMREAMTTNGGGGDEGSRRGSGEEWDVDAKVTNTNASALRQEYARKSDELLEYVASLEASVERMKADAVSERSRYDNEKRLVRNQIDVAVAKVHEAQHQIKAHLSSRLDSEHKLHDALYRLQEEECRCKELETKIMMLKTRILELEEEKRRKKERKEQKAQGGDSVIADNQNESSRKKATLAWMLGCLSDAYLQSEASDHSKTASLLKLVRKLQRELEHENLSLTHGGNSSTSMIGCHYIENEMRRLLELCDTPTLDNEPKNLNVPLVLPQLSTPRSLNKQEYLVAEVGNMKKKQLENNRSNKSPARSPARTPRK